MKTLQISPDKTFRILVAWIALLATSCLVGQIAKHVFGHTRLVGFVSLFDMDGEGNIASWYSASALGVCVLLLWGIGLVQRRARAGFALHWIALGFVFLYLSADEASQIHERSTIPLQKLTGAGGLLFFTWLIPGVALLLVFVALFARFILGLPPSTRREFIFAGAVFVSGAVVMEMIGGAYLDAYAAANGLNPWELWSAGNMTYASLYIVEETLEMLGVAFFIRALLRYVGNEIGEVRLRITPRTGTTTSRSDDIR